MAKRTYNEEFEKHTVSIDHTEWVQCKGGLKSFKRYNEMVSHYVAWEDQS